SGHDHERAEHGGQPPVPAHDEARGERRADTTYDGAERDQPPDRERFGAQPADLAVHAALEEDHRDGAAHENLERSPQLLGLDDVGYVRPQQYARHQEDDDAGHADVPRNDLRDDARREGQAYGERRTRLNHRAMSAPLPRPAQGGTIRGATGWP